MLVGDAKPIFSATPLYLGIKIPRVSLPIGLGGTASANSRMRRLSVFLLMALIMMMMLSLTRPTLVNGRVLASTVKEQRANIHEPREQPSSPRGISSVEKETDKPAENQSGRVLMGKAFHTMASGPSRKGSGH